MLPRALLFSSDEQAAAVLQEVLSELQVEVAYCREIFAAVEELTSRSFQIIMIDWGQELEASFLFNMARELKTTRTTHTLLIVGAQIAPALVVNPDGFLEKPFSAEQARRALLQSPPFRQVAQNSAPQDRACESLVPEVIGQHSGNGERPTRGSNHFFTEPASLTQRQSAAIHSLSKRIGSDFGNSQHGHGSVRPQSSTGKKAFALGCLLALLIAVVHGEKQLGYLPAGFFGYRQFTKMLFIPQKSTFDRSPTASSKNELETLSQASAVGDQSEDRRYTHNFGGAIAVRPIFGEGFSTLHKSSAPLIRSFPAEIPAEAEEPAGPGGLNPLIPESLYHSPQLLSVYGSTSHPLFNQTAWSTGAPIMIPEEISRALLVHQVVPSYPMEALQAGLQGTVVLQALVGRDGRVEDLKLVQGYFALGHAAIAAVKQWQFRPYKLNGEIVEIQTLLTLTFPFNSNEPNRASSNGSFTTYGVSK